MQTRFNASAFIVMFCLMMSGCKIALIAIEGGQIRSASGVNDCSESANCVVEIKDTFFNDTFTAVPSPGYEFVKWKSGKDFICGDLTSPSCIVNLGAFAGNPLVEATIASDEMFFLLPIFRQVGVVEKPSGCSTYAAGTTLCADGVFPNCEVTRKKALQLTVGMSYDEVMGIFGCHGSLERYSSNVAQYRWGLQFATGDALVGFQIGADNLPRYFSTAHIGFGVK